jgi:hypothetical protein
MSYCRRSVEWTAGELVVLFSASVLFVLTVVPAVAAARTLFGPSPGALPLDPRGLFPVLGVFVGSLATAVWCVVRVERRSSDRHRRRLLLIASQLRESREEAERQRLLQAQEEEGRRRERRLTIASTLFMVAGGSAGAAYLALL